MSPAVRGVVERRILVNYHYRFDAGRRDEVLPGRFSVQGERRRKSVAVAESPSGYFERFENAEGDSEFSMEGIEDELRRPDRLHHIIISRTRPTEDRLLREPV